MNDSISRHAAIDAVKRLSLGETDATRLAMRIEDYLERLPSAQPMRKKGKWTIEDCHAATYKYCCSNCKAHHRARYDFCPSCGTKMEREE